MTKDELQKIVPANKVLIETFYPHLIEAMIKFEINTKLRIAAFIAQIAHESGAFRYTKELWGPTPQQLKYEPPSKLATDLGNINKGDGARFKGRGFIQITGRANYTKISGELKINFVNEPELLEQPKFACLSAAWFWNHKYLNVLADKGDFLTITKKINGGTNGREERERYYQKALEILT